MNSVEARTMFATDPNPSLVEMSGAQLLLELLLQVGVETIFGYPGGAIMPVYDALYDYRQRLRHVLVRHEQGASHAAEGYARATGKVGVCMATSGPGATNLVTGIADAMLDSVPLVCITGQVGRAFLGTDAFQETDVIGVTIPITKWNVQVTSAEELLTAIPKAFAVARSG
jgi:acetolactate synthase-1/2/3 large subunit